MKVLLSIKAIKAVIIINWDYPIFPKANDRICISDFVIDDMSNVYNVTCTIQPSLKFKKDVDGDIYCVLDARL